MLILPQDFDCGEWVKPAWETRWARPRKGSTSMWGRGWTSWATARLWLWSACLWWRNSSGKDEAQLEMPVLFNPHPEFAVTFLLQENGKGTLGKSVSLLKLSVLSSVQSLVPNKGPSWCRMLGIAIPSVLWVFSQWNCTLRFPIEVRGPFSFLSRRLFLPFCTGEDGTQPWVCWAGALHWAVLPPSSPLQFRLPAGLWFLLF